MPAPRKDIDWNQVAVVFASGMMSQGELSRRTGIPKGTIASMMKRMGVKAVGNRGKKGSSGPQNDSEASLAPEDEVQVGPSLAEMLSDKGAESLGHRGKGRPSLTTSVVQALAPEAQKGQKSLAKPAQMTVFEAVTAKLREQGTDYLGLMGDQALAVAKHVHELQPDEYLRRSDDIERVDRIARRTFGFDKTEVGADGKLVINLSVLQQSQPKMAEGNVVDI